MSRPSPVTEGKKYMIDITEAFSKGKGIISYVVAGDPDAEYTVRYILALERAGANIVQIGIPFSDPIADDPAQKDAALRGLASGTNLDSAFRIVEEVRRTSNVPLSIVSYLNPVFGYGYERFFSRCEELSISSVFLLDMPFEERSEVQAIATAHSVGIVSSIYPSSKSRVGLLADHADAFIYLVPIKVTHEEVEAVISEIKERTDVPIAMKFGATTPEDAKEAIGSADGLAISSGVVDIIGRYGKDAEDEIVKYIQRIRNVLIS